MKKIIFGLFTLCFVMLLACCNNGPKLEGTWVGDAKTLMGEDVKEFQKAELCLTFDAQHMTMVVNMEGKIDEGKDSSMEIGVKANVEYNYTRNGDKLDVKVGDKKPSVEITKFKMTLDEETQKLMEKMGMTEEKMKEELTKEMKPEEMTKDLPNGTITIKELTETTLVITDESGKDLSFTRKQQQ